MMISRTVEAVHCRHGLGVRRRYQCRAYKIVASSVKRNVLVVGGGGREHALCWKLRKSRQCGDLYCFEGNAGIFAEADIRRTSISDIRNHEEVQFLMCASYMTTAISIDTLPMLMIKSHPTSKPFEQYSESILVVQSPWQDTAVLSWQVFKILDVGCQVVEFCQQAQIDVAVIGPEAPLVNGLVDDLTDAGILAFGPNKAAAQLEGSKSFVKRLCKEQGIPTGAYEVFTDVDEARAYVRAQGAPLVVKADGLAAGKGAIICKTESEALEAIDRMLVQKAFKSAGQVIVIEEFLKGEEASFFALIDGNTVVPLTSAQDHKAVGEGDVGENTGGMGAYSPAPIVTSTIEQIIMSNILQPTAEAMTKKGIPFRGVLFAGLMIDGDRVDLLEYNVRFGDPECQAIMMRLESDLLDLIIKTCNGRLHTLQDIQWSQDWALTVVMASKGYPGPYQKGTIIGNLDRISEAKIFHAGTALNDEGQYVSHGGRVLGITATGSSIDQAQERAYAVANFHK